MLVETTADARVPNTLGIVVGVDGTARRVSSSPYVQVREAISDVARQVEDLSWINLSAERATQDIPYEDRKRNLARIRLYRRRNPLAKQGANLLQHYALGQGISLRANNRTKIAPIVDEFWEDPINAQVFTSHQSQKERLDDVFTDGDLFMVLFPDAVAGTLHLGKLDAMYVEDVITDPDNGAIPKWYKVVKPDQKFNFTNGEWEQGVSSGTDFVYYRDWRNDDELGGRGAPPKRLVADGLIYHSAINRRGKFGESELAAAMDWIKAHKDFMEDRASINHAAAQVAWKKKRKGGQADINAEVARLQSSITGTPSRWESNPPVPTASTIVENEGTNLQWMETKIGSASDDERTLRMMLGAGMGGIPNHYFGDEASANLATATAMELPLLKTYEDWQTFWGDVCKDIVGFLLDTAHKAGRIGKRDDSRRYSERVTTPRQVLDTPDVADQTGAGSGAKPRIVSEADPVSKSSTLQTSQIPKTEPVEVGMAATDSSGAVDWFVDMDFPPIVMKDVGPFMTAIKGLYEMLPVGNIESQKLVVEMALNVLGENNIDEVMERLFPADASPDELRQTPNMVNPADPAALTKALQGLLGSGTEGAPAEGGAKPKSIAEAIAEFRVRRVLLAARQATDALDAVGA